MNSYIHTKVVILIYPLAQISLTLAVRAMVFKLGGVIHLELHILPNGRRDCLPNGDFGSTRAKIYDGWHRPSKLNKL